MSFPFKKSILYEVNQWNNSQKKMVLPKIYFSDSFFSIGSFFFGFCFFFFQDCSVSSTSGIGTISMITYQIFMVYIDIGKTGYFTERETKHKKFMKIMEGISHRSI